MACMWFKTSPSLKTGIKLINQLEEMKFEQFLRRILVKLKIQDTKFFTDEERRKLENIFKINDEQLLLSIKTIVYVFKKILKFIYMPSNLKNELLYLGFNEDKVNFIIKVWSSETKLTLNELASTSSNKYEDNPNLEWKLNSELSSEYHKKSKIPKAYISFSGEHEVSEVELTHQELKFIFLQVESIQNELDNIM